MKKEGLRRSPTLYKHRGKWYARFWDSEIKKYSISRCLGIPVEGKKERRDEAIKAADKIEAELTTVNNPPQDMAPTDISDKMLLDYVCNFWNSDSLYVKEKSLLEKKPLSAHYLLTNRQMVKCKMEPFVGFKDLKLKDLTKPVIRQWKVWLAEQGYSGRVINGAMLALRVPIRRAYEDNDILNYPFMGIKTAVHKEKKRGILKPAEIKRLSEMPISDVRARLAIYLPLYCSMRMGEVRGLLWGDVQDGIIHIQHNWQEVEKMKTCKCGSDGYVPMLRIVAELLNELYKIAPLNGPGDFVMSIKPNKPICREYLWNALRSELSKIGIDEEQRKQRNIVYHSMRHNFVTACRVAGLSDFETMMLSRHRDVKQLQRYSDHSEFIDIKALGARLEKYVQA